MRPDFSCTRRRGDAERVFERRSQSPLHLRRIGRRPHLARDACGAMEALRASASPREPKSTLSYSNMFTLCSPRIGGQAHGA